MIEAPLSEGELAVLSRLAPDGAVIFELGCRARGAFLHGTKAIARMRANHRLSAAGAILLGRAYLCAGLLSASLKGGDAVALRFDGDGSVRGLSVEARAGGLVRGRLFAPTEEPAARSAGARSAGALGAGARGAGTLGAGVLTVSRNAFPGARPYIGTIAFSEGIDETLSAYYRDSEQTPSAFRSSVLVGAPQGAETLGFVLGAGAWYLQELPGAARGVLERAAEAARSAPDPAAWFSEGGVAEAWVMDAFDGLDPTILGRSPFSFDCDCSRSRFASFLGALEPKTLAEIAENGPFPLKISCHSCGSEYEFDKPELEAILAGRVLGPAG